MCDEIIKKFPDTYFEREAHFKKFYSKLHQEENIVAASTILNEITKKYGGSEEKDIIKQIEFASDQLTISQNIEQNSSVLQNQMQKKNTNILKGKISSYELIENFPNPFNPTTTIVYTIPAKEDLSGLRVSLKVYDALGREVATLVNEVKMPGRYEVTFDGSKLSSGIYYYSLKSGNYQAVKKLVLMK